MTAGLRNFDKISKVTLIVLFLLIGVGGLVRVTGSGMGCPDWPKCFGLWVPPTCECQLPANYHDLYKDHGYPEGINFDPVKTWIEYLNRLLGVITGLLLMVNFFQAYQVRKQNKAIFFGSMLCFVMVVLEGIVGAFVVKLNLQQQSVSLHYFMALVLVCCLIYSIASLKKMESHEYIRTGKNTNYYLTGTLVITVIQMISGVHLRSVSESLTGISVYEWLHLNEKIFVMHRFYALIVVLSNLILWLKFKEYVFARIPLMAIGFAVSSQIITGILLNYFNFPRLAQVLHILLPAIIFCSQFYIICLIIFNKETVKVSS